MVYYKNNYFSSLLHWFTQLQNPSFMQGIAVTFFTLISNFFLVTLVYTEAVKRVRSDLWFNNFVGRLFNSTFYGFTFLYFFFFRSMFSNYFNILFFKDFFFFINRFFFFENFSLKNIFVFFFFYCIVFFLLIIFFF